MRAILFLLFLLFPVAAFGQGVPIATGAVPHSTWALTPACLATLEGASRIVTDAPDRDTCSGGGATPARCTCEGDTWVPDRPGAAPSLVIADGGPHDGFPSTHLALTDSPYIGGCDDHWTTHAKVGAADGEHDSPLFARTLALMAANGWDVSLYNDPEGVILNQGGEGLFGTNMSKHTASVNMQLTRPNRCVLSEALLKPTCTGDEGPPLVVDCEIERIQCNPTMGATISNYNTFDLSWSVRIFPLNPSGAWDSALLLGMWTGYTTEGIMNPNTGARRTANGAGDGVGFFINPSGVLTFMVKAAIGGGINDHANTVDLSAFLAGGASAFLDLGLHFERTQTGGNDGIATGYYRLVTDISNPGPWIEIGTINKNPTIAFPPLRHTFELWIGEQTVDPSPFTLFFERTCSFVRRESHTN
jgi:hypothetical protein